MSLDAEEEESLSNRFQQTISLPLSCFISLIRGNGLLWHAFQIDRELVLSNDKGSTKIPLMHEARPSSSGMRRGNGIQHLLPRPHGAIAPDHPPKQMHAWVSVLAEKKYITLSNSSFEIQQLIV